MKKNLLNRALWAMLLLMGVFTMTACGDDDDDTPDPGQVAEQIVGVWESTEYTMELNTPVTKHTATLTWNSSTQQLKTIYDGKEVRPAELGINPRDFEDLNTRTMFNADGTFVTYEYDNGRWDRDDDGTYRLSGTELTMKMSGEDAERWTVKSMTANKMVLLKTTFEDEDMRRYAKSITITLSKVQ